ncbi:MAG: ATP-binding protein [Planctomycetes bacterium]|nr:ATP-binding protein [Planctomycetota bacterium]
MWIHRAQESRILEISRHFPAVVLTGARQAGKTALLKRTFPNATFLTFDYPGTAQEAKENPEKLLSKFQGPIILDEVQYVPELFRYLKIKIDADRQNFGRFLMTGSQKFQLMKNLSESLAGRIAILELDTLSFHEISATQELKSFSENEILWRGGFPQLYRDPQTPAREFFQSYVATYLERDVREILRVGNLRDFERFLRICAARAGQLLNLSDLARDVGIAGSTARDWISVLEASCQIILLQPYFNNLGKRLVKSPKLYFRDTGLLCFLLGFESAEALEKSPHIGAVWENFVFNQILREAELMNYAGNIYFWRDAHGTEVDFAIHRNGKLTLIEAKYTETPPHARQLQSLLKIRDFLGAHAAAEHLIACRSTNSYVLPDHLNVRIVNGFRYRGWFGGR